jgi:hypothetical protein
MAAAFTSPIRSRTSFTRAKQGLQVATIEIPINHLLYVEAVELLLP